MYVIESNPSATGAKADHRLPLRGAEIDGFARALATAVGAHAGGSSPAGEQAKFLQAVAAELQSHKGSSVVIAGDHQPPAVHALAHAINVALGNVSKTVVYTETVNANPVNQTESLRDLVSDMQAGKVDLLVILGGNPAYDAPADLGFADALLKTNISMRVYHGLYRNETAELCQWNINEAHYLVPISKRGGVSLCITDSSMGLRLSRRLSL
jgi:molybdopterin-containing oxidoreductase family iron-sulfur binding subunit